MINKFLYFKGIIFDIYGFPVVIFLWNFGYIIYFIYNNKVILLFLFLVLLISIYFWLQIIINNFDSFINLSMNEYLYC